MASSTAKKPALKENTKSSPKDLKRTAPTERVPAAAPDEKAGGPFEDNFDASIRDLFVSELKDMYWSEKHLVGAIPKMVDAARGVELKKALSNHLKETINQVARLETVFSQLNIPVLAKKCDAMEGLTIGGEHVIENTVPGSPGRETGVIGSGIKVEQFEITCYQGLIDMATQLGLGDAVNVFQQNLEEEILASDKLNALKGGAAKKL